MDSNERRSLTCLCNTGPCVMEARYDSGQIRCPKILVYFRTNGTIQDFERQCGRCFKEAEERLERLGSNADVYRYSIDCHAVCSNNDLLFVLHVRDMTKRRVDGRTGEQSEPHNFERKSDGAYQRDRFVHIVKAWD